ncbi:hypothetical protein Tco_0978605 [Tanacetum coccineum]|uniref:Uncharacterized protein n=1 Tax=Tanacetum coccineum TaxID=301880 RepID=A0ABQ5ENV3_9ASTR
MDVGRSTRLIWTGGGVCKIWGWKGRERDVAVVSNWGEDLGDWQFWSTASLRASEEGPPAILATIDRTPYTITESLVRSQLQLNDGGGVEDMPIADIYLVPNQFSGNAAPSNPSDCPLRLSLMTRDHSHDHESTPPRPTTTTSSAPVNEQGHSSDPNIASSSRPHESAPDQFTSTNVEDETMGGSFHTSPPRSTQAPPEGTTSGGAEDLNKLTTLSSLVSTLVQKVNTQESELNAHKLLFKGRRKAGKKVKLLVDKLKGRKRKLVMTDSDKEEDAEQDVDPLIKLAKAAATAAADSAVPTGGSHEDAIPPSSNIPSGEFAGDSDVLAGATPGPSADPFNNDSSQKAPIEDVEVPSSTAYTHKKDQSKLREMSVLWEIFKVLIDSPEVNDGSDVWQNQNTWSIQSWKLYSYSGVHVLETVNGLVLEICQDTVGFVVNGVLSRWKSWRFGYTLLELDHLFLVADSKVLKLAFGGGFKM